jgi:heme exporter protein D
VIVALSSWGSVAASYLVVFVALLILVVRSAQRGRKLAEQVPEDQRRWM